MSGSSAQIRYQPFIIPVIPKPANDREKSSTEELKILALKPSHSPASAISRKARRTEETIFSWPLSFGSNPFIRLIESVKQNHPVLAVATCSEEFPSFPAEGGFGLVGEESRFPMDLIFQHFQIARKDLHFGNFTQSWNERFPDMHVEGVLRLEPDIEIASEYDIVNLHVLACAMNARIFLLWTLDEQPLSLFSLELGPLSGTKFDIPLAIKRSADRGDSMNRMLFQIVSKLAGNVCENNGVPEEFFEYNPCVRTLELSEGHRVPYFAQSKVRQGSGECSVSVSTVSDLRFPTMKLSKIDESKFELDLIVGSGEFATLVNNISGSCRPPSRLNKENRVNEDEAFDIGTGSAFLVSEGMNCHYLIVKKAQDVSINHCQWNVKDIVELDYKKLTESLLDGCEHPFSYEEIANCVYLRQLCALHMCERVRTRPRFITSTTTGRTDETSEKDREFWLPYIEEGKTGCYRFLSSQEILALSDHKDFGRRISVEECDIFPDLSTFFHVFTNKGILEMNLLCEVQRLAERYRANLEELKSKNRATRAVSFIIDREYREMSMIHQVTMEILDKHVQNWDFLVAPDEIEDVRNIREFLSRIHCDAAIHRNIYLVKNSASAFPVRLKHMQRIMREKASPYPAIPRTVKPDCPPDKDKNIVKKERKETVLKCYELFDVRSSPRVSRTVHGVVYSAFDIKYAFIHGQRAVFVCASNDRFFVYDVCDSSCVLDHEHPYIEENGEFLCAAFNTFHNSLIVCYMSNSSCFIDAYPMGKGPCYKPVSRGNRRKVRRRTSRVANISKHFFAVCYDDSCESVYFIDHEQVHESPSEAWQIERLPHLRRFLKGKNVEKAYFWDDGGSGKVSVENGIVSVSHFGVDRDTERFVPKFEPRVSSISSNKRVGESVERASTLNETEAALVQCFPVLIATQGYIVQYKDDSFVTFRPPTSERLLDIAIREFYQTCADSLCLFSIEKFLLEDYPDTGVQLVTVIDVCGRFAGDFDSIFRTSFSSIPVHGVSASLTRVQIKDGEDRLVLIVYFNEDSAEAVEAAKETTGHSILLCDSSRGKASRSAKGYEQVCLLGPAELRDRAWLKKNVIEKATYVESSELLVRVKQMIARYLTYRQFAWVPQSTRCHFCKE